MQHFPGSSPMFTAEANAVDLALDCIRPCDINNKFIIFSDSLSVLKALNHTTSNNRNSQCYKLLANKEIVLCCIPSQIGVLGNEMVDLQAKASLH